MPKPYKIPESVLIVIYTPLLEVLLIRRADGVGELAEFWQSVTGSKDTLDEPLADAAVREVREETGIESVVGGTSGLPTTPLLLDWHLENVYSIYPRWLHRYGPGVSHNTEHVFGLQVPFACPVQLAPREHTHYQWLPYQQAAEKCFSPSNAEAILWLPRLAESARMSEDETT